MTMKIPHDLIKAEKVVYKPCGFILSELVPEKESTEYDACDFILKNKSSVNSSQKAVKFRTAKITPTKNGQFVTFWKRSDQGPIEPFDETDPIDLFIVSCTDGDNFGQFLFSKEIMVKHGLISKNKKSGKRAMRVYPPWVKTTSDQAKKTQKWQTLYFISMNQAQQPNLELAKKLLQS
jgi:hypothetical protein